MSLGRSLLLALAPALACSGPALPAAAPVAAEARLGEAARARPPEDRARAEVAERGTAEVVELLGRLVALQTVAAAAPPAEAAPFVELEGLLRRHADEHGLELGVVGAREVIEVVLPGARREPPAALRLLAHADVAPVNEPATLVAPDAVPEGWTVPAFTATHRDGFVWGRGTQDDKNAIAQALVVMAALRRARFVPRSDVVLAIGTAEEHAWEGMIRYAGEAPPAEHVVSIDADFPVVVAEAGFVRWALGAEAGTPPRRGRRPVAVEAEGGLFLTQVPDEARLVLEPRGESCEALAARAGAAADEEERARRPARGEGPFRLEARAVEREGACAVEVVAHGRAVHSSVADQGANALWPLASTARRLDLEDGGLRSLLDLVTELCDGDHHGERLGVSYRDELMGELLVSPTMLRLDGGRATVSFNMRRPQGRSSAEFSAALDEAAARIREAHPDVEPLPEPYVGEPHVVGDGPLVRELLDVYADLTGVRDAEPISMRGGSYARLFRGAVSFGPLLPTDEDRRHGADERIAISSLDLGVRLLLEAVSRLSR